MSDTLKCLKNIGEKLKAGGVDPSVTDNMFNFKNDPEKLNAFNEGRFTPTPQDEAIKIPAVKPDLTKITSQPIIRHDSRRADLRHYIWELNEMLNVVWEGNAVMLNPGIFSSIENIEEILRDIGNGRFSFSVQAKYVNVQNGVIYMINRTTGKIYTPVSNADVTVFLPDSFLALQERSVIDGFYYIDLNYRYIRLRSETELVIFKMVTLVDNDIRNYGDIKKIQNYDNSYSIVTRIISLLRKYNQLSRPLIAFNGEFTRVELGSLVLSDHKRRKYNVENVPPSLYFLKKHIFDIKIKKMTDQGIFYVFTPHPINSTYQSNFDKKVPNLQYMINMNFLDCESLDNCGACNKTKSTYFSKTSCCGTGVCLQCSDDFTSGFGGEINNEKCPFCGNILDFK